VSARSLADDLRGRSDDELAHLFTVRPDLLHPIPPDITALAARAGSATSIARALDRLDAPTLAIAQAVAALPEPIDASSIAAAVGTVDRGAVISSIEVLRSQALLWGEVDVLRLVRAAREALLAPARTPVNWPTEPLQTVDRDPVRVARTAGQYALATVMAVTAIAENWSGDEAPAVLRKGGLGVRDLTATARLLDTNEHTAALWTEIGHAAGLLGRDGEVDERWRPTPEYDEWHDNSLASQWVRMAQSWLTMPRAPIRVTDGVNALSDDMQSRGDVLLREQVIRVLRDMPPGCAPAGADQVVRGVDLLAPRHAGPARAAHITAILTELEALGLTGLGALAPMGGALSGHTSIDPIAAATEWMPPPLDHILIQADLTAVAPGPLVPEVARELRLMADVESTGGATVYRFTPESIRRAMDSGRGADSMLTFLTDVSRTPVPQPLAYLLEDTSRRHGVVRIGISAAYIRCDDPTLIASVLAHPHATKLGCTRIAPTVISVNGPLDRAVTMLRQLGLHPVAEDADGHVVLPTSGSRRAPRRPDSDVVTRRDVTPSLIHAALSGLRSGATTGDYPPSTEMDSMAAADTIAVLRRAISESATARVAYGDEEYLVEPLRMSGGTVTAIDRVTGQVRNLAVARIGAALITD